MWLWVSAGALLKLDSQVLVIVVLSAPGKRGLMNGSAVSGQSVLMVACFISTTHTVWGLNDGNSEDSHAASSMTAELSMGTVLDKGPGNTSLACKSNVGPVLRKATTVSYSIPSNQAW